MIIALIQHPAGYDVDLFAMLCVRPTEDGKFCVTYEPTGRPDPRNWDKCFDRPQEAVDYFLMKRQELKLGIDFEVKGSPQERRPVPPQAVVRSQQPVVRQPSSKPQGL